MLGTILGIIILAVLCPVLFFAGAAGISGAPNLTPLMRYLPVGVIYTGAACGVASAILFVKLIISFF